MTRFLFVYRRSTDAVNKLSAEQMQQQLQRWQNWLAEGLDKGWLIERGDGLEPVGRIVNAKKVVLDGPFVEAKEIVGGFSIVSAE